MGLRSIVALVTARAYGTSCRASPRPHGQINSDLLKHLQRRQRPCARHRPAVDRRPGRPVRPGVPRRRLRRPRPAASGRLRTVTNRDLPADPPLSSTDRQGRHRRPDRWRRIPGRAGDDPAHGQKRLPAARARELSPGPGERSRHSGPAADPAAYAHLTNPQLDRWPRRMSMYRPAAESRVRRVARHVRGRGVA